MRSAMPMWVRGRRCRYGRAVGDGDMDPHSVALDEALLAPEALERRCRIIVYWLQRIGYGMLVSAHRILIIGYGMLVSAGLHISNY